MSHYYSEEQTVASHESTIDFNMGSHSLKLTTDAGVFSKGGVDFGSKLLVQTFLDDAQPKRILDVGCGYGTMGLMVANHFLINSTYGGCEYACVSFIRKKRRDKQN